MAHRDQNMTTDEWKLIVDLLESERANLPVEIHHASVPGSKEFYREKLHRVEQALSKARGKLTEIPGTDIPGQL